MNSPLLVEDLHARGADPDKFERFSLTAKRATKVKAPLIAEWYANFECRLHEDRMHREIRAVLSGKFVKAHVAVSPKRPKTIHYRGNGELMVAGSSVSRRARF